MTIDFVLIKQAYANSDVPHGKIVYQKNQAKVLPQGEAATKGWKKASAAQLLYALLEYGKKNSTSPDLKEHAQIAKIIKDRKNQKSSAKHFKTVRNFFSKLQNLASGLGFQTFAQMEQKILVLSDPAKKIKTTKSKTKTKKGNQTQKLSERKIAYAKKQFDTFKAARLANQSPAAFTQPLDLKSKILGHEKELEEIYDKIEKGQFAFESRKWKEAEKNGVVPDGKAMNGGPDYAVFEVSAIPGIIFKIPRQSNVDVEGRYESTQKCRGLINTHNLNRLYIPAIQLVEDSKKREFLIEEKVEIGHFSRTEQLYEFCSTDPELKESFKVDIEQLTTFFCLTKFRDGKSDNMPILENGKGIALIDLDDFAPSSECGGLIESDRDENIGLVKLVHPDFIPLIEETVKRLVPPQDFAKIDFAEVTADSKKRNEVTKAHEVFYEKNGVVDEKSLITSDISKLGLSTEEQAFTNKLIEFANSKFSANYHLPLKAQRNVSFQPYDNIFKPLYPGKGMSSEDYKMPEKVLKILVQNEVLFSYKNRYGHGYSAQF